MRINLPALQKSTLQRVTIVTICYNEEQNLKELFERLNASLAQCQKFHFEIILVDNCSTDNTRELALDLISKDLRWKYIRFSRNFGAEASLAAGLKYASGDAAILLMSDLQDPPEKIAEILHIWKHKNCDVVYGIVKERSDSSWLKTIGARIAYWLINKFGDVEIPQNATDYRLLSRQVIDYINEFGERVRYLRGLIHWIGFRQESFYYDRSDRKRGTSSASLLFCVNYAITAIVSLSTKPLKIASVLGAVMTAVSLIAGLLYIVLWALPFFGVIVKHQAPAGWTTLTILLIGIAGSQFFFLGLLGEYLGQTLTEVKARPRWAISESHRVKALEQMVTEEQKQEAA